MAAVIRRYEITDDEWEQIKLYIPEEQEAGSRGRTSKDSRIIVIPYFLSCKNQPRSSNSV